MGGIHYSRTRWCRIVGGLLIAAATPAAAVVTGTAPLGTPAPIQDGLLLTATGEILYDSNLRRVNSTTALDGLHKDDFRYSPTAKVTYGRSSGLLSLTAEGVAGRDFFQNNTYLDKNHYVADGTLTYHSGSSCQAVANGSYASRLGGILGANDAVIDPTAPPDDTGQVINNLQTSLLYGLNANCGSPGGRLSFGGGYNHSSLRNGSASRKFADSDGDTFSGTVGIGILRPGQVALNGSYSMISYPDRLATPGVILPPQLLSTGVRTYRIGVSLSRPIGTRLSGTIGVSYLHAQPTGGGQSPYSSPAYNLGLTYTASPRLSFALNGSRDIIASTTAGALYRVVDQVLLTGNYTLGEAISFDANVGLIANDYKQSFAIPGEPPRRNEMSKTGGISVTYAPRPLYDVTLAVSQTMRTADPSVLNYNSTKASITFAVHI